MGFLKFNTSDLTLPTTKIVVFLKTFLWSHFVNNFDSDNVCTFHYLCPCCHCSSCSRPYFT